jgi:predicted nucleic acid-binding protein
MLALMALEFNEAGPVDYLDEAFRLIAEHKVTFYDAAYHALAISEVGRS